MRLAIVLIWTIFTAGMGALYVRVPANPDQSMFDYMGWVLAEGGTVYVDAGEVNWPGKILLHWLSAVAFGNHLWAYRILDYLLMLGTCAVLYALCRHDRRPTAAVCVVPLYSAMYATAGYWMAGERDVVAAHFLLAAGLAFLIGRRSSRRLGYVVAGMAMFVAVIIRPTYLAFAFFLLAADVGSRQPRGFWRRIGDHLVLWVAFLACAMALAASGWRSGATQGWFDMAVRYNLEVYAGADSTYGKILGNWLRLMLDCWHWYLAFAFFGAWIWFRSSERRSLGVILCVGVTAMTSAIVQKKGFSYHIGGLLPVLAAPIAVFLGWLIDQWRARPTSVLRILALTAGLAIAVVGSVKKCWSQLRPQVEWYLGNHDMVEMLQSQSAGVAGYSMADVVETARYVSSVVGPEDSVLTWDRPVAVNHLAGRRYPTKLFNSEMYFDATGSFSLLKEWVDELRLVFSQRPPKLILLPGKNAPEEHANFWHRESPALDILREVIVSQYELDRCFGSIDVYRLRTR